VDVSSRACRKRRRSSGRGEKEKDRLLQVPSSTSKRMHGSGGGGGVGGGEIPVLPLRLPLYQIIIYICRYTQAMTPNKDKILCT